jgi:hypothetical protein
MNIHGGPSNRHFLPAKASWRFAWRETILPNHRNVSRLVTHANGDAYFVTATMPPARSLEDSQATNVPECAYLSRYSSAARRIVRQVPLSVEACLASPLLLPDGSLYTVEADRLARWSEDLELLDEIPLYDPPELDRGQLLFPYRYDGAASLNYDPRHKRIHAVSLCGRWITIDAETSRLARPIEKLSLFVSNTPAVDAETGTVYVVGVPHAGALASYDQPPARRSALFARLPLPVESKALTLQREDLRFVDLLILGLFGDLFDASEGELLALVPDGETYNRRSARFEGSSETSATIGYDGSIYLSDGIGNFLAFDAELREKWRFPLPGGESFGSPSIDPSGAIYVVAGRPREIGVLKLRDQGDHAELEWSLGGRRLYRDFQVEQHPVQLVASIFAPSASGVGFCLGYQDVPWETVVEQAGLSAARQRSAARSQAQLFAIELSTGRVLGQAEFGTFSFIGVCPLGDELLAPSFDLLDERFDPPGKPAGVSIYEFQDASGA